MPQQKKINRLLALILLTLSRPTVARVTICSELFKQFGPAFKTAQGALIETDSQLAFGDGRSHIVDNIVANFSKYQKARGNADGYIQFLESVFGFRFAKTKADVVVPEIIQIEKIYNAKVDALVKSGVLRESETLRPAFAYVTKEKNIIFLPFNETPPVGAIIYKGVMDDLTWHRALSQGWVACSPPTAVGVNGTALTAFEHDLAHLVGYLTDPSFMKAIRKGAQRLVIGAERFKDPQAGEIAGAAQFSASVRWGTFFVNELLMTVDPVAAAPLIRKLELPIRAGAYTVSDVQRHLNTLAPETIEKLKSAIKEAYPKLVRRHGGSAQDLVSNIADRIFEKPNSSRTIDARYVEAFERPDPELRALAALQVWIVDMPRLSPAQWADQLITPGDASATEAATFLKNSGVLSNLK